MGAAVVVAGFAGGGAAVTVVGAGGAGSADAVCTGGGGGAGLGTAFSFSPDLMRVLASRKESSAARDSSIVAATARAVCPKRKSTMLRTESGRYGPAPATKWTTITKSSTRAPAAATRRRRRVGSASVAATIGTDAQPRAMMA